MASEEQVQQSVDVIGVEGQEHYVDTADDISAAPNENKWSRNGYGRGENYDGVTSSFVPKPRRTLPHTRIVTSPCNAGIYVHFEVC
jgi:hypothetical protein